MDKFVIEGIEMRTFTVKKFSKSGHIILPKEWVDKEVKVILSIEQTKESGE